MKDKCKKISEMFDPNLSDKENAKIIGLDYRFITIWREMNGYPRYSKKSQTDKKIEEVYDPKMSYEEVAAILDVSAERVRRWRRESQLLKPSKKYRTDMKISDLYNPDLSDIENAKIIGVGKRRIWEWRKENNIVKVRKNAVKVRKNAYNRINDYKIIESLYKPELSDAENAEIIGVKVSRIKEWKKDNPNVSQPQDTIVINDVELVTIERFPDYMVNKFGQVFSRRTWKMLKPLNSIDGYVCYALMKDKKRYNVNAQRLVADAFIPNPENKTCVRHIDGNKKNNEWTNLEWCYRNESESFMIARKKNGRRLTGRKQAKETVRKRGIKVSQYTLNGEWIANYDSCKEAYRTTGIDRKKISVCCQGRLPNVGGYIWKHTEQKSEVNI